MKTYEQVLNRAVLNGFHEYFGGGSYYRGAHDFVDAVTFIYSVPRDKFMEDIEHLIEEVKVESAANNWYADDIIAYLKNK